MKDSDKFNVPDFENEKNINPILEKIIFSHKTPEYYDLNVHNKEENNFPISDYKKNYNLEKSGNDLTGFFEKNITPIYEKSYHSERDDENGRIYGYDDGRSEADRKREKEEQERRKEEERRRTELFEKLNESCQKFFPENYIDPMRFMQEIAERLEINLNFEDNEIFGDYQSQINNEEYLQVKVQSIGYLHNVLGNIDLCFEPSIDAIFEPENETQSLPHKQSFLHKNLIEPCSLEVLINLKLKGYKISGIKLKPTEENGMEVIETDLSSKIKTKYGFNDILSVAKDFRPYVHRMLEIYAGLPEDQWHDPIIYNPELQEQEENIDRTIEEMLNNFYSTNESKELKEKLQQAKLKSGRWVSIPNLNLGIVSLPVPKNDNHRESYTFKGGQLFVEVLSSLNIMTREEAHKSILPRLIRHYVHDSGFQKSKEKAREIVDSLRSAVYA